MKMFSRPQTIVSQTVSEAKVPSTDYANGSTSIVRGDQAMADAGQSLAKHLISSCTLAGSVIFLSGELGAGKTTFCRGFLRYCGVEERIKSPTYTLIEQYQTPHAQLCHLDLYRIADYDELEYLGFRELLEGNVCLLIEWPERVPELDSIATMRLHIDHVDQHSRKLSIQTSESHDIV